ncbi:MAG: putative DNA-binding protein (MmcQ/YjbR family) [Planctomycetota bacterium]|jgi:predicted DNA-binding protein (MmcQ/YjbR family)
MSHSTTPPSAKTRKVEENLRAYAMTFPEAWEDHPWGEIAFKVRKKIFFFLGSSGDGLSLSLKLPESSQEVLLLPFTEPTGYGLGKSGWVSAKWEAKQAPAITTIKRWIDESYRAVAPKTLVKQLDV